MVLALNRSRSRTVFFLITLPLITLLISFHPWFSPALAAGENPPLFDWPVKGRVTMPFRPPAGPYWQGGHAGIDIEAAVGTEVRASADGRVSFAGFTPVGLCISLDHGGGFRTTYVSLKEASVRRGERVKRGQVIAKSDGAQDRSSGCPHLHFGMYLDGKAIDPLPFLSGLAPDPGKCLFLGPCDESSPAAGGATPEKGGGSMSSPVDGEVPAGKNPLSRRWDFLVRGAKSAWEKVSGSIGGFFKEKLWGFLVASGRRVASAATALFSSPYARGAIAGILAALAVCAVVITGGLMLGISAAAIAVACSAGALTSLGCSLYMAASRGGDMSFWGCFGHALVLGLSVGFSTLFFQHLLPFFSPGYSSLGLAGFLKSFVAYGSSGSLIYILDSAMRGGTVDLRVALVVFLVSGLAGSLGKAILQGFSSSYLPAMAGGGLSSGGGSAVISVSWALGGGLSEKISFVLLSGCLAFLSDFSIRLATGTVPGPLEAAISFAGGCVAGFLAVTLGTRILSNIGARLRLLSRFARSDFLRGLASNGLGNVTRKTAERLTAGGMRDEREGLTFPSIDLGR
ncbi:MAG: M23 family metallopeptidase [Candidatus Geothermincolales bacterium]